ncbi:hypothetical protein BD626DRAFT_571249 [Schizophyllum amplum]|uniref:Uncharacterized protein n=1 Tax=Schizophyllum amplum TaxID=97359 RepID=A0A550C7V4_9AGAR|nr:hypothetical protein BD626DRAFT_571249 [Auriculariopsis ampla]
MLDSSNPRLILAATAPRAYDSTYSPWQPFAARSFCSRVGCGTRSPAWWVSDLSSLRLAAHLLSHLAYRVSPGLATRSSSSRAGCGKVSDISSPHIASRRVSRRASRVLPGLAAILLVPRRMRHALLCVLDAGFSSRRLVLVAPAILRLVLAAPALRVDDAAAAVLDSRSRLASRVSHLASRVPRLAARSSSSRAECGTRSSACRMSNSSTGR